MNLTAADLQTLSNLQIDPEIIQAAQIQRVTSGEAQEFFGINSHGKNGLVFPYFGPFNGNRVSARMRLDVPIIGDSGHQQKYASAYGDNPHVYFAPTPKPWLADPTTPLFIVEAEKSALAVLSWARRHNFPLIAIALGGCFGFRGKVGIKTNADGAREQERGTLADIELAKIHREAYICYDANADKSIQVKTARDWFTNELLRIGAREVLILNIPHDALGINGPDDLLGSKDGDRKFFRMLSHAESRSIETTDVETTTSINVPDMPPEVLDTALGDIYLKRCLPASIPVAYGWPALVAVAGTMVPTTSAMPTNLFTALVGPTHSGKSVSAERAFHIFGVDSPVRQDLKAGSGESLMKNLEDAQGDHRLDFVDELSHLFTKSKIENSSFPSVLCDAFYKTKFDMAIAHGKIIHVNCRLGIIGGIVEENFQDCFGASTTFGLYDRFIFGRCPDPWEFHWRPFEYLPEQLDPVRVMIDGEVYEARDEWIRDGIPGRVAELSLRVAVICASIDRRPLLTANNLQASKAFAEYQTRVRIVLAPNPGENQEAKLSIRIQNFMRDKIGWLNERDVYRKTHSDRYGDGVFRKVIQNLCFARVLERKEDGKRTLIRLVLGGDS